MNNWFIANKLAINLKGKGKAIPATGRGGP
jgi:hypothetical protein